MTTSAITEALEWQKLTNVFGSCRRCERPGRPLFRYQLEPDHFETGSKWTTEDLCNIETEDPEGCYWCAWSKEDPFMLCPPCYGIVAGGERAALDQALAQVGGTR